MKDKNAMMFLQGAVYVIILIAVDVYLHSLHITHDGTFQTVSDFQLNMLALGGAALAGYTQMILWFTKQTYLKEFHAVQKEDENDVANS